MSVKRFTNGTVKKGWDKCGNLLNGFCLKDIDSARVWDCVKGFPKFNKEQQSSMYVKCNLPKGKVITVCKDFYEEVSK